MYAIPAIHAVCQGVYTNTVPVDAYRGAGRPEATYLIERLMDAAARELGLPPDEIRRRNFIRPDQMPYTTASGPTYDCGDFARNMDDAMAAADWAGFEARRAEAAERGRLRGIGMSTYVEICGFDEEEATVQFLEDGTVEVLIGTQSSGQGHETAYAQIAADGLGLPIERIRVVQGDTDRFPSAREPAGRGRCRWAAPPCDKAVKALIDRGKVFASHLLQARQQDIRFADGQFTVAGSSRGIGITQLARAARDMENLPPGEMLPELRAVARYRTKASTFPNGCHVCELEIDPETGAVELAAYHVVDDFGTIVNPILLTGQVRGGVVQGIGQALMEETVYDRESGQLLSGSFLDYAVPRASQIPSIEVGFNSIPCTTNPLGIKGAGEAGTIAACPAVINAVIDALSPLGIRHIDMPATPGEYLARHSGHPSNPILGARPLTLTIDTALVERVRQIALRAGEAILDVYNTDFEVERKDDASPVTEADQRAETLIVDAIRREITDAYPIVAEEAVAAGDIPDVGDGPSGWWTRSTAPSSSSPARASSRSTSRSSKTTGRNWAWSMPRRSVPPTGAAPTAPSPPSTAATPSPGHRLPGDARKRVSSAVASRSHRTPETDEFLARYDVGD